MGQSVLTCWMRTMLVITALQLWNLGIFVIEFYLIFKGKDGESGPRGTAGEHGCPGKDVSYLQEPITNTSDETLGHNIIGSFHWAALNPARHKSFFSSYYSFCFPDIVDHNWFHKYNFLREITLIEW